MWPEIEFAGFPKMDGRPRWDWNVVDGRKVSAAGTKRAFLYLGQCLRDAGALCAAFEGGFNRSRYWGEWYPGCGRPYATKRETVAT